MQTKKLRTILNERVYTAVLEIIRATWHSNTKWKASTGSAMISPTLQPLIYLSLGFDQLALRGL